MWENFYNDLIDVLLYVPLALWDLFLDGLAAIIEAIPVPDFLATGIDWSILPYGMDWFFYIFNLAAGLAIILAAWILRFLIRRLPFIG